VEVQGAYFGTQSPVTALLIWSPMTTAVRIKKNRFEKPCEPKIKIFSEK
jgi:hypothetical protein